MKSLVAVAIFGLIIFTSSIPLGIYEKESGCSCVGTDRCVAFAPKYELEYYPASSDTLTLDPRVPPVTNFSLYPVLSNTDLTPDDTETISLDGTNALYNPMRMDETTLDQTNNKINLKGPVFDFGGGDGNNCGPVVYTYVGSGAMVIAMGSISSLLLLVLV